MMTVKEYLDIQMKINRSKFERLTNLEQQTLNQYPRTFPTRIEVRLETIIIEKDKLIAEYEVLKDCHERMVP